MRHLATIVAETRAFRLQEAMAGNTRQLVELNATSEKSAATLNMLMLIAGGVLAFDILDRITGTWTVMDTKWLADFSNPMIRDHPVRARCACAQRARGERFCSRRRALTAPYPAHPPPPARSSGSPSASASGCSSRMRRSASCSTLSFSRAASYACASASTSGCSWTASTCTSPASRCCRRNGSTSTTTPSSSTRGRSARAWPVRAGA